MSRGFSARVRRAIDGSALVAHARFSRARRVAALTACPQPESDNPACKLRPPISLRAHRQFYPHCAKLHYYYCDLECLTNRVPVIDCPTRSFEQEMRNRERTKGLAHEDHLQPRRSA